jgi:hypothetical protein
LEENISLGFIRLSSVVSHSEVEYVTRVFEHRMLQDIFGPYIEEKDNEENCIIRSYVMCKLHYALLNF